MKNAEAKILFESGVISETRVYKSESEKGWILKFVISKPVNFPLELQSERGPLRIFKSIDAAISAARNIGVSEVIVVLSPTL